jgi:protein SCO1
MNTNLLSLLYFFNLGNVRTFFVIFSVISSATPLKAEILNDADLKQVSPDFTRSIDNYQIPNIEVIRRDGKKLAFIEEIDDGRPVILNFVFASCSAICPILSQVFSQIQVKLGEDIEKVHLISISIDPENDTPTILNEYAQKFGAGTHWDFYTSSIESNVLLQKAFNIYRGDKMNHASVIFMRAAPGKSWLRLEGLVSPVEVIRQFHVMTSMTGR